MNWTLPSIPHQYIDALFTTPQQNNSNQPQLARLLYKEGLQYDPIYGAISLALPYLMAQQYVKDRPYYIKNGTWIKLRISDNGQLSFDPPGFAQRITRTVYGHSRHELCRIRKHLVKALKWTFESQDPSSIEAMKTIFSYTIKGLQELEASYGPAINAKPLEVNIGNDKIKLTGQVEEQNQTSRCLEQDRLLIESILAQPQEAGSIIDDQDKKLFELRNLSQTIAIQEKKNIDQKIEEIYFQEIKALWPANTLIAIANLFQTKQSLLFDPLESIQTLIKGNPAKFIQIQEKMNSLTSKVLKESLKAKQ